MTQTITSVDVYGKTHEVPVSELEWRPSVYGIVIRDDKVLLSPQFEENRYDLPGGGVALGEQLEAAVIREVKEETGLDVRAPKLIDGVSNFFTFTHDLTPNPVSVQSILLFYTCEFVGGDLSVSGFDEQEKQYAQMAVWVPIAELDSIGVASSYDWRELVKRLAVNENTRD